MALLTLNWLFSATYLAVTTLGIMFDTIRTAMWLFFKLMMDSINGSLLYITHFVALHVFQEIKNVINIY